MTRKASTEVNEVITIGQSTPVPETETSEAITSAPGLSDIEQALLTAFRSGNKERIVSAMGMVLSDLVDRFPPSAEEIAVREKEQKRRERKSREQWTAYEESRRLSNLGKAYGVVGRLLQTGILDVERFNILDKAGKEDALNWFYCAVFEAFQSIHYQ